MFFASSPHQPFSSLNEALALFPEWKMVTLKEYDFYLKRRLTEKSSPINSYWEYIHSEEGKKYMVSDRLEALEFLRKPGHFYLGAELEAFQRLLIEHGIDDVNLQVVHTEEKIPSSLGLPKHSPWTKQLSRGE
jgi:hypothetical protein